MFDAASGGKLWRHWVSKGWGRKAAARNALDRLLQRSWMSFGGTWFEQEDRSGGWWLDRRVSAPGTQSDVPLMERASVWEESTGRAA